MTEPSPAERAEMADKIESPTKVMLALTIVFAALALVDLVSGFFFSDWRLDVLLLGGTALGFWGLVEMRWLASKIRTNQVPRRLGVGRWIDIVLGSLLSLAFVAGMGYLTGGPWSAVVFVAVVIVLISFGTVRGMRQRKRSGRTAI